MNVPIHPRTRTLKKAPMDIRLAVAVRTLRPHLSREATTEHVRWLAERVLRPDNPYDAQSRALATLIKGFEVPHSVLAAWCRLDKPTRRYLKKGARS